MRFDRVRLATRCALFSWGLALGAAPAGAQNLLTNPRFQGDLSGWSSEFSSGQIPSWSPRDAYDSPTSGSAHLLIEPQGSYHYQSLSQCIPVTPLAVYDFGGSAYRPLGLPLVQLFMSFHTGPACGPIFGASVNATIQESRGDWEVFATSVPVAADIHSAQIFMWAANSSADQPTEAWFDNLYVRPAAGPPAPARFYTVSPCRAIDTRSGDPLLQGPALRALGDRSFAIAGRCGVPADATAVAINVTVTGADDAGDVRLYVRDSPFPLFSTLNYAVGQTRANNAVAVLGAEGEIVVRSDQATGRVDVILDVTGYFR